MKYLLDTDTVVEFLRGRSSVRTRVASVAAPEVAVSSVTLAELYYGASRSARPEERAHEVARFADVVQVIDLGKAAARQFGTLRTALERRGERLDDMDLLIASVALAGNFTLVTHNTRHFGRVPGLPLEDWVE